MIVMSRSAFLLGHCSCQLCKSCIGANMVYSWSECVFILNHHFTSKSFAGVHEALSTMCANKEVQNQTVYQDRTKYQNTGSVCIVGYRLWPPQSPDLTLNKYFILWRFLKEWVSLNNPQSLEELKHYTEQTVTNNYPEILRKIAQNTKKCGFSFLWR